MTGVRTRLVALLVLTVVCALVGPAAAGAASNSIFTVAGNGTLGFAGDSGMATAAQINQTHTIDPTPSGGYLIVDTGNNRVRRVSALGIISTVAGTGTTGLSGDGGPATAAQLNTPSGVAALPDGGFLILDRGNDRVRRVAADGTISTVAGTTAGFSGDGGPATAAQLDNPQRVEPTADGGYLIGDYGNNRIRRVSPAGTITTVAGTGTPGFAGDGGQATAAQLSGPAQAFPTADGGFLIADRLNSRVRRVAADGTITTVAGTGGFAFSGDGGLAVAAQLGAPFEVETTPEGGFLIADSSNNRIRNVSPGGTIATVTGNGTGSPAAGDGGPATLAALNPLGIAVTSEGRVLASDFNNNRIRFVDTDLRPGPAGTQGSAGPQGATGPPGPPGLQGAAGPSGAVRLAAALADSRYRARRGRSLRLRYVVTRSARVTLDVLKGRRRVARRVASAAAGRNQIRLRAPKKTGRYTLRFSVRSSDGQATSDSARLTVSR